MKNKHVILLIGLTIFTFFTNAQLKVDQYGKIGMGTIYPNPGYQCHIKNNLLITSYPASPYYELVFRASNPLPEIGSSADEITFWKSWVGHNKLYAQSFNKESDKSLKENIEPIKNGLSIIQSLNAYSYDFKDNLIDFKTGDSMTKYLREYGFISQEVKQVLKGIDITKTAQGILLMDYDQIIPITVSAIQEQQLVIDSLSKELDEIKRLLYSNNFITESNDLFQGQDNKSILFQNTPNPFNQKTEIKFLIDPESYQSASLVVFDMNGLLIKEFEIRDSGEGFVQIDAGTLRAGMYIYSLLVNQREVASKRMILID